VKAIDAPTPNARIANHIMTSEEAAKAKIVEWNNRANIPAYVEQIKQAQDAHDASMAAIDRAMAKLSAAPPEMPTSLGFNAAETASIGLGALFGGGMRAIAPISGVVGQMAGNRQKTAFENAMRRFSVDQDLGKLEYERALRDSEYYRQTADGWQRAGAEDASRLQNDARNLYAQTLGWQHSDEADQRNFDQQRQMAALAVQDQAQRDQANRDHDTAMLELRNAMDIKNDKRAESRAIKQQLLDAAQNADSGDAVDAAITQFRKSGGEINDNVYEMLRTAAERRAAMADMRLQNATYSAMKPSGTIKYDPVTGAPMGGAYGPLPGVLGAGDGTVPMPPSVGQVAPVFPTKPAVVPGKNSWDSMLYKPQVEIIGKLRAAVQQKAALARQWAKDPTGPDITDPRVAQREKQRNDIDGDIRKMREDLELKLTPEMREFRRQTADVYLGHIKAFAKDPKYAGLEPADRKKYQAEIRKRFREEFGVDIDWRRIRD
jgi:hypothetical protein